MARHDRRPQPRGLVPHHVGAMLRHVARHRRPDVLALVCGFLLPCPGCGVRPAGTAGLCPRCRRRALRPGSDGAVLWLGPYAGPLGRAVRALKYRQATRVARWLGAAMATAVAASGWRPELVCAVPLHPARLRQRGYNQASLLARPLAADLGVPYRALLTRRRATRPQAHLRREARAANVAGAFAAGSCRAVRERRVLLVDDVLTTGATAQACRAALLAAGAGDVRVAVVARAGSRRGAAAQNETSSAVPMPTSAPTSTCG